MIFHTRRQRRDDALCLLLLSASFVGSSNLLFLFLFWSRPVLSFLCAVCLSQVPTLKARLSLSQDGVRPKASVGVRCSAFVVRRFGCSFWFPSWHQSFSKYFPCRSAFGVRRSSFVVLVSPSGFLLATSLSVSTFPVVRRSAFVARRFGFSFWFPSGHQSFSKYFP